MLAGTGKDDTHLVVVMTANRGLAGGFNSNIIRSARGLVRELLERGKTVKILAVGRKGRDAMRRDFRELIVGEYTEFGNPKGGFAGSASLMFRNAEGSKNTGNVGAASRTRVET